MKQSTHARAVVPYVKADGKVGVKMQVNDRSRYKPRKNTPKSQRRK